MNQAAKTVSDALLGLDFMNVEIGGMVYTIKPPTIKIICRAIHHFSISAGLEIMSWKLLKSFLKLLKIC